MTDTTIQTHSQAAMVANRTTNEVLDKTACRRFTAEYKQRILTEADACAEPGAIGNLPVAS